ncbi:MAG: hypothetical protein KF778_11215 [Rhodocyclaceae bacterium]|nr:hypothetical protein [Rhodocyclaceae bacterium]
MPISGRGPAAPAVRVGARAILAMFGLLPLSLHAAPDQPSKQESVITEAQPAKAGAEGEVRVAIVNSSAKALDIYQIDDQNQPQYLDTVEPAKVRILAVKPGGLLLFGDQGVEIDRYEVTAAADQAHSIVAQQLAAEPSPPPPPPRVTEPAITKPGDQHWRQVAGLRPGQATESGGMRTEFKLRDDMAGYARVLDGHLLTIRLLPKIWAWRENGTTYVRIDTKDSRASLTDSGSNKVDSGVFIRSVDVAVSVPYPFSVAEYFPTNKMGSTAVSQSAAFSVGANAGPSPYTTSANLGYNQMTTTSRNADDYEVAVSESSRRLNFEWRLCAIGSADNQARLCNYNEPWNLGVKVAGQLSQIYELPPITRQFDAMRNSLVLSAPNVPIGDLKLGLTITVTVERVWLTGQVRAKDPVGQAVEGFGRGFIGLFHPDTYKGELLYKLHSKSDRKALTFDLVFNTEAINP